MKKDDFRHMRRGKQLAALSEKDIALLKAVQHRGKGHQKALLMLHGFSSSPAVYRYLLPQLLNYDAILCPVLPGHAESVDVFSSASANDWIVAAEAICAELLADYRQVDVLGLSLGGLLACHLSQKFVLNHLYLLAPALALRLPLPARQTLQLVKLCHWFGFRFLNNAAGDFLHATHTEIAYRRLPLVSVIEILSFVQQFNWRVPQCPTDVFLGCYDRVVDNQKISSFFENQPNVKIHWMENSGHVLPLDNDLQCLSDYMNAH